MIIIPVIEKMVRVSLRLITMDVPPQDIITKDNVSVKVNAVVYFRVMEPDKAIVEVEDFYYATSQLAQTTLRSILGQVELDDLLSEREKINHELQEILDTSTDPWGVKVTNVEITHPSRGLSRDSSAGRDGTLSGLFSSSARAGFGELASLADLGVPRDAFGPRPSQMWKNRCKHAARKRLETNALGLLLKMSQPLERVGPTGEVDTLPDVLRPGRPVPACAFPRACR